MLCTCAGRVVNDDPKITIRSLAGRIVGPKRLHNIKIRIPDRVRGPGRNVSPVQVNTISITPFNRNVDCNAVSISTLVRDPNDSKVGLGAGGTSQQQQEEQKSVGAGFHRFSRKNL